jgi:F-type H+-transporting ATPase subunit epsilon
MASLQFSLVSPEKVLLDQPVSMVVIPGLEGDIGVLPGHAPLLTLLRPGVVTVYEEDKILIKLFVDGGFSEITPEKCTTLVTEGIPLDALDKRALEIEIKNLIEDVADSKTTEERKQADQNLNIAQAKLMEVLSSVK